METNNLKSLDGGTINSAINENVNDFTRVMNQVDNNIEKTEMRTEDMQPDKKHSLPLFEMQPIHPS